MASKLPPGMDDPPLPPDLGLSRTRPKASSRGVDGDPPTVSLASFATSSSKSLSSVEDSSVLVKSSVAKLAAESRRIGAPPPLDPGPLAPGVLQVPADAPNVNRVAGTPRISSASRIMGAERGESGAVPSSGSMGEKSICEREMRRSGTEDAEPDASTEHVRFRASMVSLDLSEMLSTEIALEAEMVRKIFELVL
jgi:hypothetical protein